VLLRGAVADGRMRVVLRQMPFDRAALLDAAILGCLPADRRAQALASMAASQGPVGGTTVPRGEASDVSDCSVRPGTTRSVLDVAGQAASEWGIDATPTFVAGRRVVPGAMSAAAVEGLLPSGRN
jgi:hypothetical protein